MRLRVSALVTASLLTVACPTGDTLTYVNETGQAVIVRTSPTEDFAKSYEFTLGPTDRFKTAGLPVEALYMRVLTAEDERLISERRFTWAEIKSMKYTIPIK